MTKDNDKKKSKKESEVYDRQIRLWGADAQARMSRSKVLYLNVTGVSSEILKNLVLAGIKAAIWDDRPYYRKDGGGVDVDVASTPSFFFAQHNRDDEKNQDIGNSRDESPSKKAKIDTSGTTVAEVVRPYVEELNPLLGSCEIIQNKNLRDMINSKDKDDDGSTNHEFWSRYGVVVASGLHLSVDEISSLSNAVTSSGGKFFVTETFGNGGMYGCCCIDLGEGHGYRPEKGKDELLPIRTLDPYVPLSNMLRDVKLLEPTNRFHKQTPPLPWMMYRCILQYQTEHDGTYPSKEKRDEFVQETKTWIQQQEQRGQEKGTGEEHLKELYEALPGCCSSSSSSYGVGAVAPVCSVLGGLIGNEIIKVLSQKGTPVNNVLMFDGYTCKALSYLIQSKQKK